MSAERTNLHVAYSRPTAWIADATIDDTRAFVERVHRHWSDIFRREEKGSDAEHLAPRFVFKP